MRAADFPVTLGRELRPDQVPLIGEEKDGITAGRQVDAGAVFQVRHGVRLPNLLAGAGFQTDEFAGGFGREHVVAVQEGGRGVAQDSLRDNCRFWPEHRSRRFVRLEFNMRPPISRRLFRMTGVGIASLLLVTIASRQ